MVEDIVQAVEAAPGYHEDIADSLWLRFGGKQKIKAHHHGVDIETTRPIKHD